MKVTSLTVLLILASLASCVDQNTTELQFSDNEGVSSLSTAEADQKLDVREIISEYDPCNVAENCTNRKDFTLDEHLDLVSKKSGNQLHALSLVDRQMIYKNASCSFSNLQQVVPKVTNDRLATTTNFNIVQEDGDDSCLEAGLNFYQISEIVESKPISSLRGVAFIHHSDILKTNTEMIQNFKGYSFNYYNHRALHLSYSLDGVDFIQVYLISDPTSEDTLFFEHQISDREEQVLVKLISGLPSNVQELQKVNINTESLLKLKKKIKIEPTITKEEQVIILNKLNSDTVIPNYIINEASENDSATSEGSEQFEHLKQELKIHGKFYFYELEKGKPILAYINVFKGQELAWETRSAFVEKIKWNCSNTSLIDIELSNEELAAFSKIESDLVSLEGSNLKIKMNNLNNKLAIMNLLRENGLSPYIPFMYWNDARFALVNESEAEILTLVDSYRTSATKYLNAHFGCTL